MKCKEFRKNFFEPIETYYFQPATNEEQEYERNLINHVNNCIPCQKYCEKQSRIIKE